MKNNKKHASLSIFVLLVASLMFVVYIAVFDTVFTTQVFNDLSEDQMQLNYNLESYARQFIHAMEEDNFTSETLYRLAFRQIIGKKHEWSDRSILNGKELFTSGELGSEAYERSSYEFKDSYRKLRAKIRINYRFIAPLFDHRKELITVDNQLDSLESYLSSGYSVNFVENNAMHIEHGLLQIIEKKTYLGMREHVETDSEPVSDVDLDQTTDEDPVTEPEENEESSPLEPINLANPIILDADMHYMGDGPLKLNGILQVDEQTVIETPIQLSGILIVTGEPLLVSGSSIKVTGTTLTSIDLNHLPITTKLSRAIRTMYGSLLQGFFEPKVESIIMDR